MSYYVYSLYFDNNNKIILTNVNVLECEQYLMPIWIEN